MIWPRRQGIHSTWRFCGPTAIIGTLRRAAGGGHIETLEWARLHGCRWDEGVCDAAIRGGHLDVLQWARYHGCLWRKHCLCELAAKHGHLDILRWLVASACPMTPAVCELAAGRGDIDMLKWSVLKGGCEWHREVCRGQAEQGGHTATVEWIDAHI